MTYTDRAVAYVTRERNGRRELLVFEVGGDPDSGSQVPAGRLEPDEELEPALVRELKEESGLRDVRIVRKLAVFPPGTLPHGRSYTNHAYELEAPGAPDEWEHVVTGEGDDAGYTFVYRWEPLSPALLLWGRADPVLTLLD